MKRSNFTLYSYLLSGISMLITLWINYRISIAYYQVDGKTQRGFFEFYSVFHFTYQYLVIIPAIISFLIAINIDGTAFKRIMVITVALSSIVLIFCKAWRWMI